MRFEDKLTNVMKENSDKVIYSHDVIEFTQVAVRFCAFLEQGEGRTRKDFTDTMLKLTPLLYLKAQMLPRIESDGDFLPSDQVTEADYNWIRSLVAQTMGGDDEYLDVAYEEALQTDETRWRSISEECADVYQPVRNFLATYQGGVEDCMRDALWQLTDQFDIFWGGCLVNVMRRLHQLKYTAKDTTENDDEEEY